MNKVNKEELFDSLITSGVSGVFKAGTAPGHKVFYGNRQFYQLIGYTKEEFEKEKAGELIRIIREEDKKSILKQAKDFIRGRADRVVLEFRVMQRSGASIWLRTECTYVDFVHRTDFFGLCCDISEQKRTTKELRDTEEKFALAVRGAGIDVWVYDIQARTAAWMQDELTGGEQKILLRDFPDSYIAEGHVREDCREDFEVFYKRMQAGERKLSGEFWIKNEKKSEWRCKHVTYLVTFDQSGRPHKAYGTGQDVTARRIEEHRYREEIDSRKEAGKDVIAFGRINLTKGVIESFNTRESNVTREPGEAEAEYRRRVLKFLIDSYDVPKDHAHFTMKGLMENYHRGETVLANEFGAIQNRNGEHTWIRSECKLLARPDNGDIIAFLYDFDRTREHNLNEILRICLKLDYDFVGTINTRTKRGRLETGTDTFSFLQESVKDYDAIVKSCIEKGVIAANEDTAKALELETIAGHLRNAPNYTYEIDVRLPNQGMRKKQLKFAYEDDLTDVIAIACTDIEDLVQEEKKKQAALESALEETERANLTKSGFLAQMSHDIRTPMNAILGMTAIARSEKKIEDILFCIDNIEISGKFLLNLINDILDISRIESGGMKLNLRRYPLEEFDAAIRANMLPIMNAKHIRFKYQMECGPDCICTDPVRINQIFFNLISNAVKFTAEGGEILFRADHLRDEGDIAWIRFIVKDNGVGMSEQFAEHAFDAFSREEGKTDAQWQGAGLGLTIVKYLVEVMGGIVALKSKKDEGTEITVDLPLKPLAKIEKPLDSAKEAEILMEGRRVLLAEDNYVNTVVATRLLQNKGLLVETADNGAKAVSMFEASPQEYFDAVLMDIRMPVMDGLEAARQIRAMARKDAARVPIVAMTANAYDEDKQRSIDAGMDSHLSKPIDPMKLYSTLNKLLSRE